MKGAAQMPAYVIARLFVIRADSLEALALFPTPFPPALSVSVFFHAQFAASRVL